MGMLSPDGLYRWDGVRWVPTAGVIPNPVPAAPPSAPGSTLAIVGGAVAIVGSLAIIAAGLLPYAHYTDNSTPAWPSIFNPGYPGALWYAAEPVAVILLGIVAGVMLIAVRGRTLRLVAAGALLAFGMQTTFSFVGFVGASATGPASQMGIGGVVGVIAGLVILVGGAIAAASVLAAIPSPRRGEG